MRSLLIAGLCGLLLSCANQPPRQLLDGDTADDRTGDPVTCVALNYHDIGGDFSPPSTTCPIDPSQPACASEDVGALVARTNDCFLETFEASQSSGEPCYPWAHDFSSELVLIWDPFDGCQWPITVDTVLDCGMRVEIHFSVTEPCTSCDAVEPLWHILHLPNDPKPVHAIGRLQQETGCQ